MNLSDLTRKAAGFKSLRLSCKEISQVIYYYQMWVSLSTILTAVFIKKMDLLQML